MTTPPTGTVTFLFTDIERSSQLWEHHPESMKYALVKHDAILRRDIERHGGFVFKTVGDAFCAAFAIPVDAMSAAIAIQRSLGSQKWGETPIKVRVSLHAGTAEERDDDYFGPTLNRVARLLATGHGGQILLSQAIHELIRDQMPDGVSVRDLGEYRLKDLIRPERIFQVITDDLPAKFPVLRTLDPHLHNLPIQQTTLIGREKEISNLRSLLQDESTRLITLTGPGGIGKTRLSLQVAADVVEQFQDGVYFIDLAPVTDPELVITTIAHSLGVSEAMGRSQMSVLQDHLRDKKMLLILDNFEQVVSAAESVAQILNSCPRVKLLVTSRENLRIRGELEIALSPLALPDPEQLPSLSRLTQYAAVTLFIERAQMSERRFAVDNENAPAVAQICQMLDGLPLAIELAAARIGLLPPETMLARLERRLPMLTGGARDLPDRHRTLRAAIDWSYDLLQPDERMLFAHLAVFSGGFTLEAAESIVDDSQEADSFAVLDGVAALTNQSLLQRVAQENPDDPPRLLMLETIREYALEKLGLLKESEALRRRHAHYFLDLAETAEPELTGREQAAWLDRLGQEHNNFRAALAWALDHGAGETAARLASALWRFWYVRGYLSEGSYWLSRVRSSPTTLPAQLQAKMYYGAAALVWTQGEYAQATTFFEHSLKYQEQLDDRRGVAAAYNGLGLVAIDLGNYRQAAAHLMKSLEIQREFGDEQGIAGLLNNLGRVAMEQGDFSRAKIYLEEGLGLLRKLGDRNNVAMVLTNLGRVANLQERYQEARGYLEESLTIHRELANKRGIAFAFLNLGQSAIGEGNLEHAEELLEQSLSLQNELGDKQGITYSLTCLAQVAAQEDRIEEAISLYEKGLVLARELGDKNNVARTLNEEAELLRFIGEYERAGVLYEESLAIAQELQIWQIVAWTLHNLGHLALHQGDHEGAIRLFQRSMSLAKEQGRDLGILLCLAGIATAAHLRGQSEQAAKILGAVDKLAKAGDLKMERVDRAAFEQNIETVRAHLGQTSFLPAWEAGRTMTMEQAIEVTQTVAGESQGARRG